MTPSRMRARRGSSASPPRCRACARGRLGPRRRCARRGTGRDRPSPGGRGPSPSARFHRVNERGGGGEPHPVYDRTILAQPLGLAFVRLVDLRVVKQLAWALKAGVEVLLALVPVAFEDVAATLGEDDERSAVADRNRSHELLFTQVPELAAAWVVGLAPAVPDVVGVHDAERAGRRQRPRFRAAQENAVLAEPHALA